MKNKAALYSLIGIPIIVILGVIAHQQASAHNITLPNFLFPDSPNALVIEEPLTYDVLPSRAQSAVSTGTDSMKQETPSDIIKFAEGLIGEANQSYLSPGWLHITTIKKYFVTASDTLPDGTPIPTHSVNDEWALLGDDGKVIKAVVIDDTGDPKTTQITVFENSSWSNLTFPEMSSDENEIYQIKSLDRGFIKAAKANTNARTIGKYDTELDGEEAIVFSITDNFPSPITYGKSSITISGIRREYYFSTGSGLPLKLDQYHITQDGDTNIWRRSVYTVIETIGKPPTTIMSYFDN